MTPDEFQGHVLARLDMLKEMGGKIETCLSDHNKRIVELEHLAIKAKAWGVVAGIVAGFLSNKLAPLIALKPLAAASLPFFALPAFVWFLKHKRPPEGGLVSQPEVHRQPNADGYRR